MKFKFKIGAQNQSDKAEVWKKPLLFLSSVFRNVKKSYLLMSKRERMLAVSFVVLALSLSSWQYYRNFVARTVLVPGSGGEYTEVMVGEINYLNPVTAQNDAEKTVTKLLFPGLIKVSSDGTVTPDLAESYTVSTDGLKYDFVLRKGLKFSDGQPLTTADIAYTIDSIQDPAMKSPLNLTFANIKVTVTDDSNIELELPNTYGPFVRYCDFGVLPAHLSPDDFSKKIVGAGPYQFGSSVKDGTRVKSIELTRNDDYYGEKQMIDKVQFEFFSVQADAEREFTDSPDVLGLYGGNSSVGRKMEYDSARQLGLILNSRKDSLKDAETRRKILEGVKFDTPVKLTLSTLDIPAQRAKAEEYKQKFVAQNINLSIDYLNSIKLQDTIKAKSYELLLYGFDFSIDRDPYVYWHSSQLGNMNLAGFSDKNADILMEDARMLQDPAARNAKYDQIFDIVEKANLVQFASPLKYQFFVKDTVKGIEAIKGNQPSSRFDQITKWYIKEKRVRKE